MSGNGEKHDNQQGTGDTMAAEIETRFRERMRSYRSAAVKRGMAVRAARGWHLHRVPLGYRRVCRDGVADIESDPATAAIVSRAFQRAADRRCSLRALARWLAGEGVMMNGKPLSHVGLAKLLRNPFYLGLVRNGDQLVPGRHTAIVPRATFDAVQDVLRDARRGDASPRSANAA